MFPILAPLLLLGGVVTADDPTAPLPPTPDAERRALEEELARELGAVPDATPPPAPPPIAAAGALKLLDLAVIIAPALGWSSLPEEALRQVELGGHDPKHRGITVQNVELSLSGVVDPYLKGNTNIVLLIGEDGASVVELEEAYLTTLALPGGLELKGGQFNNAFGRLNGQHPHSWDFADQPIVNGRFFGPDGLRNPGLQLSWLTPLPFFAELVGSVQNGIGETAVSFRAAPGEEIAGRTLGERPVETPAELLYLARLRTSFDAGDEVTFVPGLSALAGPNATGEGARTEVYGADLFAKWRPLDADSGWTFVSWQSEAMLRRYHAGPGEAAGVDAPRSERLDDWGLYSQLLWAVSRPWIVGARVERARGEASRFQRADGSSYALDDDPLRAPRTRLSGIVTYLPSEFSKLRLQYNWDRATYLPDDGHTVFLQAEIMYGAHGAHRF